MKRLFRSAFQYFYLPRGGGYTPFSSIKMNIRKIKNRLYHPNQLGALGPCSECPALNQVLHTFWYKNHMTRQWHPKIERSFFSLLQINCHSTKRKSRAVNDKLYLPVHLFYDLGVTSQNSYPQRGIRVHAPQLYPTP